MQFEHKPSIIELIDMSKVYTPKEFEESRKKYMEGIIENKGILLVCKWCNKIYTTTIGFSRGWEFEGFCSGDCFDTFTKENNPEVRLFNKKHKKNFKIEMKETNKKKCVVCGYKITLVRHHLNKNRKDNRPKNLLLLCPNHHYAVHQNKINLFDYGITIPIQSKGKEGEILIW